MVHHKIFHLRLSPKKNLTVWGNHGGGEQQCGNCGYQTDKFVEEEGSRKRDIIGSIDVTGVHTGVQSRCGLSTILSESLSKPGGLF